MESPSHPLALRSEDQTAKSPVQNVPASQIRDPQDRKSPATSQKEVEKENTKTHFCDFGQRIARRQGGETQNLFKKNDRWNRFLQRPAFGSEKVHPKLARQFVSVGDRSLQHGRVQRLDNVIECRPLRVIVPFENITKAGHWNIISLLRKTLMNEILKRRRQFTHRRKLMTHAHQIDQLRRVFNVWIKLLQKRVSKQNPTLTIVLLFLASSFFHSKMCHNKYPNEKNVHRSRRISSLFQQLGRAPHRSSSLKIVHSNLKRRQAKVRHLVNRSCFEFFNKEQRVRSTTEEPFLKMFVGFLQRV
jgi:hypothetical protein